jgi:hypothetical protein
MGSTTSDDGRSGTLGLSTFPVLFLIRDRSVSLSTIGLSGSHTLSVLGLREERKEEPGR